RKLLEQPVHYIIGANGTGPAGKARLSICAVFRQEQKMLPDITGSILIIQIFIMFVYRMESAAVIFPPRLFLAAKMKENGVFKNKVHIVFAAASEFIQAVIPDIVIVYDFIQRFYSFGIKSIHN